MLRPAAPCLQSGVQPKMNDQGKLGDAGMTLVELLVVMTLIGLISVMLAGGFSFGTRVWETVATSSGDFDRIVHTQRFLVRQLTQAQVPTRRLQLNAASPSSEAGQSPSGAAGPVFTGSAGNLIFSAPWQKALGQGQFFRFELTQAGEALEIIWTPVEDVSTAAGPDTSEFTGSRALLENIQSLAIRYYGSEDGAAQPQWHSQWAVADRLPDLVEISVDFTGGSGRVWPRLVVSLSG